MGFSVEDVPEYLLKSGSGLWQVPIRVNVAPDGKVRSCEVEGSGGISDLKRRTCQIVMRRAKFRGARIDGLPTYGVFRTSIMWAVADSPWDTSKALNSDIEVTVQRLPRGVKSPSFVSVMFAVDAAGNKSACVANDLKGTNRVENHPTLVPIACEQIIKNYRAIPAKDETGKATLSVQTALVRFSSV